MALSMGVVDDDHGFRRLMVMLARARGFDVVCEATDMESAVNVFAAHRPEVGLVDFHLPDGDGIELARRLLRAGIDSRIVLTSTDEDALPDGAVDGTQVWGAVPNDKLAETDLNAILSNHPVRGIN